MKKERNACQGNYSCLICMSFVQCYKFNILYIFAIHSEQLRSILPAFITQANTGGGEAGACFHGNMPTSFYVLCNASKRICASADAHTIGHIYISHMIQEWCDAWILCKRKSIPLHHDCYHRCCSFVISYVVSYILQIR